MAKSLLCLGFGQKAGGAILRIRRIGSGATARRRLARHGEQRATTFERPATFPQRAMTFEQRSTPAIGSMKGSREPLEMTWRRSTGFERSAIGLISTRSVSSALSRASMICSAGFEQRSARFEQPTKYFHQPMKHFEQPIAVALERSKGRRIGLADTRDSIACFIRCSKPFVRCSRHRIRCSVFSIRGSQCSMRCAEHLVRCLDLGERRSATSQGPTTIFGARLHPRKQRTSAAIAPLNRSQASCENAMESSTAGEQAKRRLRGARDLARP